MSVSRAGLLFGMIGEAADSVRDVQTLEEIRVPPGRRASIPEPPCLSGLGPIALPSSFFLPLFTHNFLHTIYLSLNVVEGGLRSAK